MLKNVWPQRSHKVILWFFLAFRNYRISAKISLAHSFINRFWWKFIWTLTLWGCLFFCTYLGNACNVGRTTRRMILKDVLFSIHIAVIGEVMEFISVLSRSLPFPLFLFLYFFSLSPPLFLSASRGEGGLRWLPKNSVLKLLLIPCFSLHVSPHF